MSLTTKNLTTKNLTNINKVATEVHRKYVAGTHVGEVFSKEKCGKKYSKEDVENMICLYIYQLERKTSWFSQRI